MTLGRATAQAHPASLPILENASKRRTRKGSPLGFWLFVAVNAQLLIRPQELYPGIESLHPYYLLIVGCLLAYGSAICKQLRWRRLVERPITLCVVALLPVVALSLFWAGRTENFSDYCVEFAKIVIYYLVFVCAVDTPARLKTFCLWLAAIIGVVGLLPMLDHHSLFTLPTIQAIKDQRVDAISGLTVQVNRLRGVGIFNDPNDLAQMLGVGVVLCALGVEVGRTWLKKAAWLALAGLMLYVIYLTQSRGGLLGLMAGLGVLFVARFGWKRAVILGALVLPMLAMVFLARTTISTDEASAQTRVQLWSDAMEALRGCPVLGVGPGSFAESAGQVVHNSFLQAFAETGVVGGLLFFTAYYVAIWGVLRLGRRPLTVPDPDMARLSPILAAALVCYCVGMLSLTRNYVIPTYSLLGLAAVYLWLVRTEPARQAPRWDLRLLGRCFALSVLYLLAMQVFVKLSVRWGG